MSVTVTNTNGTTLANYAPPKPGGRVAELTLDWTSKSDGTVDCVIGGVSGKIIGFETKPDSGGTQPTDLYDLTLKDRHGVDLLAGGGANRSNANAERIAGFDSNSLVKAFARTLALSIQNAGSAKGGLISVYIEQ